MKYVYYLVGMCMISCTYMVKNHEYQPCHFDRANLTVVGNDLDFKDSICFRGYFRPVIARMLDDYSIVQNSLFSRINSKYIPKFDIKICHCKDTLWAKQQILEEIKKLYPFSLIDTVINYRKYKITLVDSTKLIRSKSTLDWPELKRDSVYSHDIGVPYYYLAKEVGFLVCLAIENVYNSCSLEDINLYSSSYDELYDLRIRNEFLGSSSSKDTTIWGDPLYIPPQKTIEQVQTYIVDSLGFRVDLINEYSIPIKLVKFSTI